ncbi:MAG: YafY family transcriptional regulator [Salaquimonas sp.]|nr:YafY family transcriptional regulator [Salaquimonas sp.]
MRRADRLFQIVQYLRAGRLLTARILAERLEVSERTIYRDIADLQASGVPIDGEAGIGYLMRAGYDLPPLMFSHEEMAALTLGARIVRAWGGARMALAAEEALVKIAAVLPEQHRPKSGDMPVYAFDNRMSDIERDNLDRLNAAIIASALIEIDYEDVNGEATSRHVEPLGLFYWGKVWTLVGWCRLRDDFRMFRIDRIVRLTEPGETITPVDGHTLQDFLAQTAAEQGRSLPVEMR